jgi:hypothetical protein
LPTKTYYIYRFANCITYPIHNILFETPWSK